MEVVDTRQYLADILLDEPFLENAELLQHRRDAAPGDVLEQNVQVAIISASVGAKVAHNVLMLELPHETDLALQAANLFLRPSGERNLLNGHQAARPLVQTLENPAVRALPDLLTLDPREPPPSLLHLRHQVVPARTLFRGRAAVGGRRRGR
eukprot:scaffold301_cov243-Pinguiococcus_pyrenoidosus.AAC.37